MQVLARHESRGGRYEANVARRYVRCQVQRSLRQNQRREVAVAPRVGGGPFETVQADALGAGGAAHELRAHSGNGKPGVDLARAQRRERPAAAERAGVEGLGFDAVLGQQNRREHAGAAAFGSDRDTPAAKVGKGPDGASPSRRNSHAGS